VKIVVADRNLTPHRERFESRLPSGATVAWCDGIIGPALSSELTDSDVFVASTFTPSMARAAQKLRLVHVAGAGTDGIDFRALPAHVQVANTYHHERSIAEYVLATSILLRRRFLEQDRQLRQGVWASRVYDDALTQTDTIGAAHAGFVGFGHIGRSAWNLLRACGCTGAAVTGRGVAEAGLGLRWLGGMGDLDELMTESAVVVVSAPLTERTRGMIGEEQLSALGPAGVLVNVGRGPLVDEKALYTALSNRDIAGAAIDVWYDYPSRDGLGAPSELPFGDLDNVVMTPHSSGITRQTFLGRVDDITANITRLQIGEPLTNIVAR
jgi:phosphoglycerate dehydrogenase-like enzyme